MTMMKTMRTTTPPTTHHKTKVTIVVWIWNGVHQKVLSREQTGKVISKV